MLNVKGAHHDRYCQILMTLTKCVFWH